MKLRGQLLLAFVGVTVAGIITNTIVSYKTAMNLLLLEQRIAMRQEAARSLEQIAGRGITDTEWKNLATDEGKKGIYVALVSNNLHLVQSAFPVTPTTGFIRHALEGGIFSLHSKLYVIVTLQYFSAGKVHYILFGAPPNWNMLCKKTVLYLAELLASGVAVSIFVSFIMSYRISRPLLKLNHELKKVAHQRFSDVRNIPAPGEVGEVTQSFYELSQELERAIRSERQFFRSVSHELKTPLMSIQGYAEGIRDGVFTGDAARSGLTVIIDESMRLKNLVNELIHLSQSNSRSNAESFKWRDTDVSDVLLQAMEIMQPLCSEADCDFQTSFHASAGIVKLDRDKLLQAFINILTNALRYAKKKIEISTYCNDGDFIVEIKDDGPGIPTTILGDIFNPFVKGLDGQSGLGLFIAKNILHEFGGTISARNGIEEGAIFRVSLPLRP